MLPPRVSPRTYFLVRLISSPEEVRGHPVGLVDDDEVPVDLRELLDEFVTTGDLVDPADQPVLLAEDLDRVGPVEHVAGDDLEGQPELVGEFVLPLRGEAAWRDDQDALGVAADHQLLQVEPGHDRLAGAWVIGEEEPQWLPGKHLAVDRFDLMRQRVDRAGGQRDVGVEEVGEVNPSRLSGHPEDVPVGIEAPRASGAVQDLEGALVGAEQQSIVEPLLLIPVDDGDGL